MGEGFLKLAYDGAGADAARALYDRWAASYDDEVTQNGYVTPGRCADALAKFLSDMTAPILDFGCGTGLSGLAMRLAGFEVIDGCDLSEEMLAGARSKEIYRNLIQLEADSPIPGQPGDYTAIAAIGVISPSVAPIETFDRIMEALEPGGFFVFSFNDHALEDPAYEAKVMEWVDCAAAQLLFREYGPHLPGIDLKSIVYVIRKA